MSKEDGILKKVITGKKYFIPKYQRGYRWTEHEVTKFLDDIFEGLMDSEKDKIVFDDINSKENENSDPDAIRELYMDNIAEPKRKKPTKKPDTYCIQPLVVVPRKNAPESYAVIDGQQRLTTSAIILAALNSYKKSGHKINIEYESRTDSEKYLELLYTKPDEAGTNSNKNIDFAHMWKAYETARDYFKLDYINKKEHKEAIIGALRDIFLATTRFIWYEPTLRGSETEQEIFAIFNTGKIELTNSELIKAVFMDPKRLGGSGREIKNAQVVISERWDEIENRLRDRELWTFIPHDDREQYSGSDSGYANRIEALFRLFAVKKNEITVKENDPFGLYEAIEKWIDTELEKAEKNNVSKEDKLRSCWDEITLVFHDLLDLYSPEVIGDKPGRSNICNLAGLYMYLLKDHPYKDRYKALLEVLKNSRDQRENKLRELIRDELFGKGCGKNPARQKLMDTRYESDKGDISRIMLTYNISLLLDAAANNSRYSFADHNSFKWDREHIFAKCADASGDNNGMKRAAVEMLYSGKSFEEYLTFLFSKNTIDDIYNEESKNININDKPGASPKEKLLSLSTADYKDNFKERGYAVRAVHAEKKLTELHGYYQRMDRIDEILDPDEPSTDDLIKQYFAKFTDEINTIRIRSHELISKLIKEETPDVNSIADSIKQEFDLKQFSGLDPNNKDAAIIKIADGFADRRRELLEKLRNDPAAVTPDEMKHIKNLLKLSKKTMQKEIDNFFDITPVKSGQNDLEAYGSAEEKEARSEFARLFADNSLGNMCLLTKSDNISVSNDPFHEKRKKVNTEFLSHGRFVPIGTTLVFSGRFAQGTAADNYWLPASRKEYLEDVIDKVCKLCFPESK